MLFTSNLEFLSPIYLSTEPQLNLGCFNPGLPSLGPVLVGSLLTPDLLSPVVVAMVCPAAFAASTDDCAMACVIAA